MDIVRFAPQYLEAIVELALRAWAPVFESLEQALGGELFHVMHQPDWQTVQRRAVEQACSAAEAETWVAVGRLGVPGNPDTAAAERKAHSNQPLGFTVLHYDTAERLGIVHMIAVDPAHQRKGIATALMDHAADRMKSAGMNIVMVETGGDPGHAPARATYESLGYQPLPVVQYYRRL